MIIAAAVKFYIEKTDQKVVLCGLRHDAPFRQLAALGFEPKVGYKELEQGFITTDLLQLLLYRINNLFQYLLLIIFFPDFFSFPKWSFLTLPIKSIHTMAVSIPQHPSQALSLHQFSNSLNFIFEFLQLILSFLMGKEYGFTNFTHWKSSCY